MTPAPAQNPAPPPAAGPAGAARLSYAVTATLLGALGLGLRLRHLGDVIRIDEATTYVRFVTRPWRGALTAYDIPNNHILNTALAKASTAVFGPAEWALRLPNLVAGVATLALVALLARRWFGRVAAVAALAVVAVSPVSIQYSVLARGYGLAACFGLLALLALDRRYDAARPAGWTIAAALAAAAALYAVPSSIMFVLPLAACDLVATLGRRPRAFGKWLAVWAGAAALTALLFLPVIAVNGARLFFANEYNALRELPYMDQYLRLYGRSLADARTFGAGGPWLWLPLFAAGVVAGTRRRKAYGLLLASCAALAVVLFAVGTPLPSRLFHYFVPLLALGVGALGRRGRGPGHRRGAGRAAARLPRGRRRVVLRRRGAVLPDEGGRAHGRAGPRPAQGFDVRGLRRRGAGVHAAGDGGRLFLGRAVSGRAPGAGARGRGLRHLESADGKPGMTGAGAARRRRSYNRRTLTFRRIIAGMPGAKCNGFARALFWASAAAIFSLGVFLRLRHLGDVIRFDEATTYVLFVSRPWAEALTSYQFPNNHLLNTALAKASAAVFGAAPWALRLPNLFAGLGVMAATAALARRWFGRAAALAALAVVAVSPAAVHINVLCRGYTPAVLLWLVALWSIDAAARGRAPAWRRAAAAAAAALAIYAVPSAMLYVAPLAAYDLALSFPSGKRGLAHWAATWAAAAALTFALYLPVILKNGWAPLVANEWNTRLSRADMPQFLRLWGRAVRDARSWGWPGAWGWGPLAAAGVAAAVLTNTRYRLLLGLAVVGVAAFYVARYPLPTRVFGPVVPIYALGLGALAAAAARRLGTVPRPVTVAAAAALTLAAVGVGVAGERQGLIATSSRAGVAPDARDVAAVLRALPPTPRVVVNPWYDDPVRYYLMTSGADIKAIDHSPPPAFTYEAYVVVPRGSTAQKEADKFFWGFRARVVARTPVRRVGETRVVKVVFAW